jgi:serine/threonine protein kinase, bacterial
MFDERYRLVSRLHGGGMSAVYLAENTHHGNRPCVIKQVWFDNDDDAEEYRNRFRTEIDVVATLRSPYIVDAFDSGDVDGTLYLAMQYVEGRDVREMLKGGRRLSSRDTADLVDQVARGLSSAHAKGIAHRDVKPGNVLVHERADPQETLHAQLIDFGIARLEARQTHHTAVGMAVGTQPYMAPERFADPRTVADSRPVDVYALACVAFECLTGRLAFPHELEALQYAHGGDRRPDITELRPDLAPCRDVLQRGMAVDPAARPSPREFAAQLREALDEAARVPPDPDPEPGSGPGPGPGPDVDPDPDTKDLRQQPPTSTDRLRGHVAGHPWITGMATTAVVAVGGLPLGAGLVWQLVGAVAAFGVGVAGSRLLGSGHDREGSR